MIHKCIRIPSIQWTPTIPQLTFKNTNNRVRVGVIVNYLSANDTLMNHLNEKQNVILKKNYVLNKRMTPNANIW